MYLLFFVSVASHIAAQDIIWYQAAQTADTSNWTIIANTLFSGVSTWSTDCPLGPGEVCWILSVTNFESDQFIYRIASSTGYKNIQFRLLIDTYNMWFSGEYCNIYYNVNSGNSNWQLITQITNSESQKDHTFNLDSSTWDQNNVGIKIEAVGGDVSVTSCCLFNNMYLIGIPITNPPTSTSLPTTSAPTTLSPTTTLPTTSGPTTISPTTSSPTTPSPTTTSPKTATPTTSPMTSIPTTIEPIRSTFSPTEDPTEDRDGEIQITTSSEGPINNNEEKEVGSNTESWIYVVVVIFSIIIIAISIFVFIKKYKKKQRAFTDHDKSNNQHEEDNNDIAENNHMLYKVQSISSISSIAMNTNDNLDKNGDNEHNVTAGLQLIEMNNLNQGGSDPFGNSDDIIIDDNDDVTPNDENDDVEIIHDVNKMVITAGNDREGNDSLENTQNTEFADIMMDDEFLIVDETDTVK